MSSLLGLFDANRPHDGAVVKGQEVRELLKSAVTYSAGTLTPGRSAVLIGDARFVRVAVNVRYRLDITINGTNKIIDLTSVATGGNVTPSDVASAINTGFSETYAYVYNNEPFDGTAFIAIVAPSPQGSSASITVSEINDGTDASASVFGLQGRGAGMPYTVTAANPPYGLHWLQTTASGEDDNIKLFLGTPARATGLVNLAASPGTLNLSRRTHLRIRIISNTGAIFGPLTIDVRGASPSATQPSEIVNAINSAFTALPGWPNVLSGPAHLVARGVGTQYLQILSGPVLSPFIGPTAAVEISGLDIGGSLGFNFLMDDAITEILGLPRGEGGKVIGRIPHTFKGSDFSDSYIRGIGNRSGAGIGPWGPALETASRIPAAGAVDGEIRVAKDTGIPWVFRQGQFGLLGSGWRRAVPAYEYPVTYDKSNEAYRLKSTNDTFVPAPLSALRYNLSSTWASNSYIELDSNAIETGRIGDVVTLVDAKDYLWRGGPYSGGRDLFVLSPNYDNFPITRYTLGRSTNGINWRVLDSNTPAITGTNNQRFRPVGSNVAQTQALGASTFTAIRAYNESGGEVRNFDLPIQSATNSFSFTIPEVSVGSPVRPSTFSVFVANAGASDRSLFSTTVPFNYAGYDNGSGVLSGTGITGTIDYTTGVVTITTSTNLSYDQHKFIYSYAKSNLQVIAIDVRKDPSAETRAGGTPAEVGIIYGASGTSTGVDTGSGFAAIVKDDGTGSLVTMTGGVVTPFAGFLVDPPLDTTWRTLRVLFQVEAGSPSNIAVHAVFWNGSNKSCDWSTKDYAQPEASLTASQTDGGIEVERVSKLISLVSYPATGAANESGAYGGIWIKGSSASGGFTEKVIQVKNYQNHSGFKIPFTQITPALPPVSGIRLRDTINAIQVAKAGSIITSPVTVISDCNARTPLQINFKGDLALSNLSGIGADRTIDIGLDTAQALAARDIRYLSTDLVIPGMPGYLSSNVGGVDRQNTNGRVAYWSLSSVLVDHAFWGGSTAGYSSSAISLVDKPYLWRRFFDGSVVGTSVGQDSGFSPVRYWNPDAGVLPNPQPSEIVFTTGGGGANWVLNTTVQTVFEVVTTLPDSGFNGINWTYQVTRAQLVTVKSKHLESIRPGWAANPGGLPSSWNINEPYQEPFVESITKLASGGTGRFARFRVAMRYYGPVCPVGIYLNIIAIRNGTV